LSDLSKTLLPARIRNLYEGRRSGVLVAVQPPVSKGVFFRNGQIVFASSTLDKEKLGEHLIRLGRISRADFMAAVKTKDGKPRRLGQALVEAGLISDEEVGRLVALQVQKIVLSLFTWTTGEAKFHESPNAIPEDLALDMSTARLLFEGVRIYPDVARLEAALPAQGRMLSIVTRPPFDHAAMSLSPAERDVLECCADGMTIAEILERPRRALLVRALYALLAGGILEDSKTAAEEHAEDVLDVDTGTFRLAIGSTPPPADEDVRTRVLRLYEALPRATHYAVLGVPPDATATQVQARHDELIAEEKGWKELEKDARMGSLVSTIKLRRRQAHHVLHDGARRESYDRALGSPRPAREAPGMPSLEANDPVRQAQRLTREAERSLAEGERDRAVSQLLEAVRVAPEDRAARRLLAVTLADHPSLQRQAERHFRAALEMEPGDVELRYRLALFYKKAGLPRRAVSELQAVLAQEPKHREGGALLRLLERSAR
jgi:tetratricopeptide (TPR) repeat protein